MCMIYALIGVCGLECEGVGGVRRVCVYYAVSACGWEMLSSKHFNSHLGTLQVSGQSDIPDYSLVHCINYDNKTDNYVFFAEQLL